MKRVHLKSAFSSQVTAGITRLCGPSERRVSLIVSPPGTGSMGISPTGQAGVANFVIFGGAPPLVITYEVWGSLVKGGWDLNDFGTVRTVAWIEVLEEADELAPAVAEEKPQEEQRAAGEEQPGDRIAPLSRRKRRAYLKQGLLG